MSCDSQVAAKTDVAEEAEVTNSHNFSDNKRNTRVIAGRPVIVIGSMDMIPDTRST